MNVLIKPIITEKASDAAEGKNVFTFEVHPDANKIEIKKAVETTYGVSVEKVRTLNVRPDRKTRYTRTGVQTGKTKAYKKAFVQVAEGDTIDFYSNI